MSKNGEAVDDTDKGELKDSEKICPSATLSTINHTWTALETNPSLCDEKPVIMYLCCGTLHISYTKATSQTMNNQSA
jgi:hypothetical protein